MSSKLFLNTVLNTFGSKIFLDAAILSFTIHILSYSFQNIKQISLKNSDLKKNFHTGEGVEKMKKWRVSFKSLNKISL
jgi:hypothetical protein